MSSVLFDSFHGFYWCVYCEGESFVMHNLVHRCQHAYILAFLGCIFLSELYTVSGWSLRTQ